MTTGRINQVAIRIAEAASDSGDPSTDVQSPACSSHESTNVSHHHHHTPNGRDRSPQPLELLSVRLPSTRYEVGISKTVKVQIP